MMCALLRLFRCQRRAYKANRRLRLVDVGLCALFKSIWRKALRMDGSLFSGFEIGSVRFASRSWSGGETECFFWIKFCLACVSLNIRKHVVVPHKVYIYGSQRVFYFQNLCSNVCLLCCFGALLSVCSACSWWA